MGWQVDNEHRSPVNLRFETEKELGVWNCKNELLSCWSWWNRCMWWEQCAKKASILRWHAWRWFTKWFPSNNACLSILLFFCIVRGLYRGHRLYQAQLSSSRWQILSRNDGWGLGHWNHHRRCYWGRRRRTGVLLLRHSLRPQLAGVRTVIRYTWQVERWTGHVGRCLMVDDAGSSKNHVGWCWRSVQIRWSVWLWLCVRPAAYLPEIISMETTALPGLAHQLSAAEVPSPHNSSVEPWLRWLVMSWLHDWSKCLAGKSHAKWRC